MLPNITSAKAAPDIKFESRQPTNIPGTAAPVNIGSIHNNYSSISLISPKELGLNTSTNTTYIAAITAP